MKISNIILKSKFGKGYSGLIAYFLCISVTPTSHLQIGYNVLFVQLSRGKRVVIYWCLRPQADSAPEAGLEFKCGARIPLRVFTT